MDPSGVHVEKHIETPDFQYISPDNVASSIQEVVFRRGGVTIARISPTLLVKYGDDVHIIEAKTLRYIAQNTSIPVPRVFAAYTHGPFDRDEEWSSKYDTYIFMDYLDGQPLDQAWSQLKEKEKSTILAELGDFIAQLRAIPTSGYIGSIDHGPLRDSILEYFPVKGPFASEQEFNTTLIDAFCKSFRGEVRPYLTGMLNAHSHKIVFTHSDLRPANVIVKGGHVLGIIDWEMAGWYPEHWEFVKAFYVWRWQNDWGTRLLEIMQPYYCEQAVHSWLTQVLL
ncbi:kinase-like protein [Lindgomyces ingoldianus]|uniref:Kinase-like protein n=1 Tax=Lindgomyces ingoldianus TaxID=673940 RepID=A0ACB6QNN3_9PLEO|nr:kinase-like protein [Lindgomyces ingoldianus]KAF2468145.1 kinase-like protein [Lindgomyces ingoldianus]